MLSEYETYLLDKIDSRVEHATDDELFAGGYLQGHITLAIAELEQENNTQLSALKSRVEESIQKAIKAGELAPPDQILVLSTWHDLVNSIN
ncbi:YfcL family protein [Proteus mirabilis]|uniref:YfcL family protein n=1 Tax=Proteus mirabilis TaxID=584 RepID=UPI0012B48DD0|nr:YfcL family protein [Proteus mirabilis]MCU9588606.1 YfcL family protein [Proteus mirabilis]MDF7394029.1 YfcL family protein [Proteus mirabilis]QGM69282.1 YfcL family protein [Proteus mirabilis]HCB2898332.1 YfcL family protein [Proteus mirabilis]HCB2907264.1 YfcL family protein [Proteus mirabilis]